MKNIKLAVILVNLGSPNQLTVSGIRGFLRRFLSDRRVVGLPRLLWLPILYLLILPFRAKKLLKLYSIIWQHKVNASPLIFYTHEQARLLAEKFHSLVVDKADNNNLLNNFPTEIVVKPAFCYANPDINTVLTQLHQENLVIDKLVILPLYPQFSSTTTLPVFDQIYQFYKNAYTMPSINFIDNFATNAHYIKAIVAKISTSFAENGQGQLLIFSYHSLPQSVINKGDPYYEQCIATTKCIARELGLAETQYLVTFQSKFGRAKWLEPATYATITGLAKNGIKHIDVVCPGFVSDCLETLEEINEQNHLALANGGIKYTYIAALNSDSLCISMLARLVADQI